MIFRRLGDSRFSEVLKAWDGELVVLIGGGPSLSLAQIDTVKAAHDAGRCKAIAVNDAYLWAPWAEVQYAADAKWHAWQVSGISKPTLWLTPEQIRQRWRDYAGEKCSIQNSMANIPDKSVHFLRNATYPDHGFGLSLDPKAIYTGRNSGFQALNIAVLTGAKRILLLGYDGAPSRDGKTHWHGDHPIVAPLSVYAHYRAAFSAAETPLLELGVEVINCSPGSAIDSFPKVPLEKAL